MDPQYSVPNMTEYGSISARLVGSEDEDAPEDALQVAPKPGEKEVADSSLFRGRGVAVEEPSLPVSGGREVNLT